MTMRTLRPLLLPLLALALALAPAAITAESASAGPGDGAGAGAGKAKGEGKRAKIRQRIRALRAWMLTESLELDEDSAAKLFPVINKYDDELEKVLVEGRDLRGKLQDALDVDDEKTIDGLVDQMVAHQQKLWDLQDKRFAAVRKVLTAKQAARILVVLPEIDRRIQNQIRKAAGRRAAGAQPAPPSDEGAGSDDLVNPFDEGKAKAKGKGKGKGKRDAMPPEDDEGVMNPFRR